MDFLNEINEKTIVVCPSSLKTKILNEIEKYNRLINIKLYSLEELKRIVYFDYDVDAILYLMNKYNYSYDIAKYYINNMYYVEDKKYDDEKLNYLVKLKKELIDNKLLSFNNLFLSSYKDTPFIIFGYNYIDSFNKKLLSNFKYKIIERVELNRNNKVYKFNNLEDEVLFVINEIVTLINNGVDINNIYLLNLDSNYIPVVTRLFDMFKIPIDISNSSNLLSTIIGNKTFNHLEESKSFEETLEYLNSFNNDKNQKIINSILSVLNKYYDLDYHFEILLSAIKHDLENTSINNKILKNTVKVGDLSNYHFDSNDYVFLLGFNQGSIPKVVKDEDYINDKEKELLGIDPTYVINKLEKEATISNINRIKNITISYKTNYQDKEFYPSNLIDDTYKVIDNYELKTDNSLIYSKIKLVKMLDNLIKYDENNKDLPKYYNSINVSYMNFDNKFSGIKKNSLYNYLDNKLTLSYSTIDTFYKCQFRYYIDNILKLNKFEESFEIFIGKLFHDVLSHVYDKDFDFESSYNNYLKDKELNDKDKFYVDKLKKELLIVCDYLKEFNEDTELVDVFTEKNIRIDKSTDINVVFKGIVDKIMYKKYDDKTLVSIIDYKTGNTDIDIYNSVYGIGMQLIVYLYLISKSGLFEDYFCVGFYLQKILNNEINIDRDKSYLDLKKENLVLYGYSTDDKESISKFDKTYVKSKYIKSMRVNKDGNLGSKNTLNEDTMHKLEKLVDRKIDEARDKILEGDFSINPKSIDNELVGCKYCKYNDLCFRKNEDIINLKKYTDLSFLEEGDIND